LLQHTIIGQLQLGHLHQPFLQLEERRASKTKSSIDVGSEVAVEAARTETESSGQSLCCCKVSAQQHYFACFHIVLLVVQRAAVGKDTLACSKTKFEVRKNVSERTQKGKREGKGKEGVQTHEIDSPLLKSHKSIAVNIKIFKSWVFF
jgi:hypothetical protein